MVSSERGPMPVVVTYTLPEDGGLRCFHVVAIRSCWIDSLVNSALWVYQYDTIVVAYYSTIYCVFVHTEGLCSSVNCAV